MLMSIQELPVEEPASDEVGVVVRKKTKKKKHKETSERSPLMLELADIFHTLEVWSDSVLCSY